MNVFFVWILRYSSSSLFRAYCVVSALIFLTRARMRYVFGSHEFDLCFVKEWCDYKSRMHQIEVLDCLFALLDEEYNQRLIYDLLKVTSKVSEEKIPRRYEFLDLFREYLLYKGKDPKVVLKGL